MTIIYNYKVKVLYKEGHFNDPNIPLEHELIFSSIKPKSLKDLQDGPYYPHASVISIQKI